MLLALCVSVPCCLDKTNIHMIITSYFLVCKNLSRGELGRGYISLAYEAISVLFCFGSPSLLGS